MSGVKDVRNVIGIRGVKEHIRRRKVWNRAFSSASIKDFEPHVVRRATELMDRLEGLCRKGATDGHGKAEVVISDWMSFPSELLNYQAVV